jgi:hypothetical protein
MLIEDVPIRFAESVWVASMGSLAAGYLTNYLGLSYDNIA